MLIKRRLLEEIAAGKVDLAFRRWKRPTVKTGGRLRTAVGELKIVDVSRIDFGSVTTDEAVRAGYASRGDLAADLADRPGSHLYRICLRFDGPDTRATLREDDNLSAEACEGILGTLGRLDTGSGHVAFSLSILQCIAMQPDVPAATLAPRFDLGKQEFKLHVRKLKELGLTESRPVGYRISARGRRVLQHAEQALRRSGRDD